VELSWSTFVLEVINFLVLIWILKRFLYQPVLNVIAERRRLVDDELAQARTTESEAEALKQQYTGRLDAWESEKRIANERLAQELEQERARKLSELAAALEQEQQKARVAEQRRQAESERVLTQRALQHGAVFSSRLLEQAAGPELERRLAEMVIAGLADLPGERRKRLREQWGETPPAAEVRSAFELPADQREGLKSALRDLADVADVRFDRDESLVAGLHIELGAWVIAANVRDELKGFTELLSESH